MEVEGPPFPPPPPIHKHWDEAVRQFLQDAGLTQAMKGFECDMLVLNPNWEREQIPLALEKLIKGLHSTRELQPKKEDVNQAPESGRSLDDRKLDYVNLASGKKFRSPTSINKDISAFLAKNRARNDASNRAEFLLSLAEKRRGIQQNEPSDDDDDQMPSCARVDARTIDRDAQMKYDIAKNDDGPLRRTKAKKDDNQLSTSQQSISSDLLLPDEQNALPRHHPGIDERLTNLESHLAVRYVPSPPRTLWARIKFLEDHVIRLEKDYPPWAALHFNQPNRGWLPPPRATPIIVPPSLRSSDASEPSAQSNLGSHLNQGPLTASSSGGARIKNTKSSLQRAVLERLEVQQAMGEKANIGT